MKPANMYHCEICGAAGRGNGWFLVSEDREGNTLQILLWNSRMAEHPGVRHLCSVAHVEELVSHWMLTGGLDYGRPHTGCAESTPESSEMDTAYRLGELMLDRAAFAALGERPDMLSSILDAIDGALQATSDVRSLLEENEEEEDAALVYDA